MKDIIELIKQEESGDRSDDEDETILEENNDRELIADFIDISKKVEEALEALA